MLDQNNLMLGNWVYDTILKKPIQLNKLPYGIDMSNIEGIEVTKDLLEKIGFEEYEDLPLEGLFYRYWDQDYKYKLDVRDFWTNSQRKWYVHIDNNVCSTIGSGEFDYLHEVQNLVQVITGYPLVINKEVFNDNQGVERAD